MDDLFIDTFQEDKISVSEKVKEEMKRLRLSCKYVSSIQLLYNLSASLKVIFHNVRLLPLHKYYIFHDFNVTSADINIFVETNLTTKHKNTDFANPVFRLHRNDSIESTPSKAMYGTAVYIKEDIHCLRQPFGYNRDGIEITVTILNKPIQSLHLVSLYKSPRISVVTLVNIMQFIHHQIIQGTPAVIVGDFNINLLEQSSQRSQISTEMNNLGYTQLIEEATTDYGSLLDHVYTNTPDSISCAGVLESYFSDHKPLFVCMK